MLQNNQSVNNLLNNFKIFELNPEIAVGVSGGPDSIALAYLLNEWIKIKKGKLFALIFDHKIRSSSRKESFVVKDTLSKLGIVSIIIKPKKNKLVKKNMQNARQNRFDGLINFCRQNKILHLFLGHHLDDNLETYLIRKINGSNIEGLECMNNISQYHNIQILRPFLQIKKKSIINFNKRNNLSFIDDPSNYDLNYTRVKIRNFLNNNMYNDQIKKDFENIRKIIPLYKKMIWSTFLENLITLNSTKIVVKYTKIKKLNDLILERHILIILKFFGIKQNQVKSTKIYKFIDLFNAPNFKIYNLRGIIITKKSNLLTFYKK
tara:strand:+ start:9722 stop:10681 length:960 start_codon:yes stop_codon:yes gene_type:complete